MVAVGTIVASFQLSGKSDPTFVVTHLPRGTTLPSLSQTSRAAGNTAFLASACAPLALLGASAVTSLRALAGRRRQTKQCVAHVEREAEASNFQSRRRDLAFTAVVTSIIPSFQAARADSGVVIQRVVVNVGDDEAVKRELKFWLEACEMKVLSDGPGSDGLRAVVVGFEPTAFAIEIKVDPAVLTRPTPRLLNYSVMQPTVDALNFIQISARGKAFDIFTRVENSGGASLIGDARYVDVESPRGVPIRMIPREETPSFELVCFNIEVPAFEATVKFYQRVCGLKEIEYSDSDAPIQKLSVLLNNPAGGPKLLLSPVPDGRMKERNLDEFEYVVLSASSGANAISKSAEDAIALAQEEERQRDEEDKRRKAQGLQVPDRRGTQSRPKVIEVASKKATIDDGVGNILVFE